MNLETKPKLTQLGEISRLQEFDIQRTLMPMSHSSAPLSTVHSNSGVDPSIPAINLRSYVALSRPGIGGNIRNGKSNEVIHPVSRTDLSVLSSN
jgi:hypothetical protein